MFKMFPSFLLTKYSLLENQFMVVFMFEFNKMSGRSYRLADSLARSVVNTFVSFNVKAGKNRIL